jgi:hypothetical protein
VKDTRADARKRRVERAKAKRDPAYVSWVKCRPCHVCGVYGVEFHHWPPRSKPGWSDRSGMPLCAEHHRGKDGYHLLGRKGFERVWGLELGAVVAEYRLMYERQVNPADEF